MTLSESFWRVIDTCEEEHVVLVLPSPMLKTYLEPPEYQRGTSSRTIPPYLGNSLPGVSSIWKLPSVVATTLLVSPA